MKRLIALALVAALTTPATAAAQPATSPAKSIAINCTAGTAKPGEEVPNLHGNWDFVMDVGGTPNFGLLSIGFVGDTYGGSLALSLTAPVVLRKVTLTGNSIQMAVASREGDVMLDGVLSPNGNRICGTVTYHGGGTFPMVAQKRPSTYRSPPQADRSR